MNKISFLNLITLLLHKHRSRHISIFIISTLLVFIVSISLFVSSSIKSDLLALLQKESDFIVQKIRSGSRVDVDQSWVDKIERLRGVSDVNGRIYGKYILKDSDKYIDIVGVDPFGEDEVLKSLNIKEFLSKDQMILSKSLKEYLKKRYFDKYFNFFKPNGEKKKVYIYKVFDRSSPYFSGDIAMMSQDLAREILGIDDDKYSDITLNVANEKERDNVGFQLKSLFYDALVIDKRDLRGDYMKYFDFKSGMFMMLFLLSLFTFMLILYQRFTLANSSERRDVAILRMVGWGIGDVIKLKLFESLIIGISAFMLGVVLAYIFVFVFDAPLFRDIFLGFGNLTHSYDFHPNLDLGLIMTIFIFFITSFVASLLIPIWKIAITDPTEAIK